MNRGTMMIVVGCLLVGEPAMGQDVGHTTTWSKAEDLTGFETPEGGKLVWVAAGGNPGGFIKAVNTRTFLPKPYLRSDLGKVFGTGAGTFSFDLRALSVAAVSGGRLFLSTGSRAFVYDFTAKKVLGRDQTGADGWVRYSIPWKADWTEAQAKAQGWRPYSGKSDKWSAVIANPIWTTLTVSLAPGKGTGESAVGIDNFRVEAGKPLDASGRAMIEPRPPQQKPVVHYAFDEGAGDALHDRAGTAPDGKISGAKWVRNGGRWALEFDGVDDFVHCGAVNVVGPKTLVAWLWAEPIYSVWLSVPILGNGSCQFTQRVNEINAGGAGFLPFRKWVHVAAAWDGKTVRLYVDGTLVNVVVSKEPGGGGNDFLLAGPRKMADSDPPEYKRRFKGRIASVVLYNRPLAHEEILEDLRTSNVTNSPMSMSIPQPGFGRIKVEVDAARLGKPLESVSVTVDVVKAGAAGGKALVSAAVKEFDAVGRAVVDISAPQLPKGKYVVRTTAKDAAGKVLGVAGQEPLAWAGSARFPSGPDGARKLNNLVTELLRVPGPDATGDARRFVNPRTGFIHASNRGSKTAKITAEADGRVYELALSRDYGETYETQRYLPKGSYTITTPAARDLIVRAVAQTVHDYAHTEGVYVTGFGPYAGEFEARHVFPHVNTFLVHEFNADKPFVKEWKAKGRRIVDGMNTKIEPKEGQSRVDALCRKLGEGAGFSHPLYDGYLVDEFAASDESHRIWSAALERLLPEPRFTGKSLHVWTYAYLDLVTYKGGGPGRELVRTLRKFDCAVQWECYLSSVRTELAAWRHVHDKIVGEALATERVCPGLVEGLIVVPYSYVTAGPPWLTMTLPTYDTRTYMEMQVRTVATDPAFAGVRGLGVYRSPYADEETARWTARLFRHYAIEGNTEPLGKDPFLLTHVRNNEFERRGEEWDVKPAEDGSIQFGMHHQFGSMQCRYTGRNGDTVLITRRSSKAPNVFSQQIEGLESGRLYSFRMFSADRKDMSAKVEHAVNVSFDGAELIPDKCFTHVGKSRRPNTFVNWHVRLFRATGKTATLRVSDWASEEAPGGPIGQELIYNFIKVQPYWPAD